MQHIAWRWKHCFGKRHFGQASLVHRADICFGASSVIDLCVSGLPMSIEQTERPAESCLSSSPGSLLSLTASTGKYLTWDKFHITGGDLNSLAEMGWPPASSERRNWAETAEPSWPRDHRMLIWDCAHQFFSVVVCTLPPPIIPRWEWGILET